MPVSENTRQELIRLCSESRTRRSNWTKERPTKWNPGEAYDQEPAEPGEAAPPPAPFTRNGAWARIVQELEGGCVLKLKILDIPKGKKAYELHFRDAMGQRVYVKLQILSGEVLARSFHLG